MKKTLIYIELPPPIHGMTYINKIIYEGLKSKENHYFHDVNFSIELSDIGKIGIIKILHNLKIIFSSWNSFFKIKPSQVYSVISASRFGIIRDFLILFPSVMFRKKRILHLHGFTYFDIYGKNKLYMLLFDILRSNAKIIVLCKKQKEKLKEIMKQDSYILYNSLQNDVKIEHKKLDKENIRLLYISNISKLKGTFDLIESIKNIKNVSLTIAGTFWTDEDGFRDLVSTMKDKVNFVGFANEQMKKELLSSHDIFCMPSRLSEGSPISIIEALAYGLPVIGTNKGCISEMINGCGYLISGVVDNLNMQKSLDEIINNYEEYSKNAICNYKRYYSNDVFLEQLEEIICVE